MVKITMEAGIREADKEARIGDERRRQVDGSQITSELGIDENEIAW